MSSFSRQICSINFFFSSRTRHLHPFYKFGKYDVIIHGDHYFPSIKKSSHAKFVVFLLDSAMNTSPNLLIDLDDQHKFIVRGEPKIIQPGELSRYIAELVNRRNPTPAVIEQDVGSRFAPIIETPSNIQKDFSSSSFSDKQQQISSVSRVSLIKAHSNIPKDSSPSGKQQQQQQQQVSSVPRQTPKRAKLPQRIIQREQNPETKPNTSQEMVIPATNPFEKFKYHQIQNTIGMYQKFCKVIYYDNSPTKKETIPKQTPSKLVDKSSPRPSEKQVKPNPTEEKPQKEDHQTIPLSSSRRELELEKLYNLYTVADVVKIRQMDATNIQPETPKQDKGHWSDDDDDDHKLTSSVRRTSDIRDTKMKKRTLPPPYLRPTAQQVQPPFTQTNFTKLGVVSKC